MAGLVWIASYPKSGNTWVRMVLSHYLHGRGGPADMNTVNITGAASWRLLDLHGVGEASEFTADEFERFRPTLYRACAATTPPNACLKVHDAWALTSAGIPLFPPDITTASLYVVRHPADVAVSYAFHDGLTMEQSVTFLCSQDARLEGGGQGVQRLGRWCDHVTSWLDTSGLPLCVLRYEDMLRDPLLEMERALRAVGLFVNQDRLAASIAACRFSVLQAREREVGFAERGARATALFFREGRAGAWRQHLSVEHIRRLTRVHGQVMHRLGYLDKED